MFSVQSLTHLDSFSDYIFTNKTSKKLKIEFFIIKVKVIELSNYKPILILRKILVQKPKNQVFFIVF